MPHLSDKEIENDAARINLIELTGSDSSLQLIPHSNKEGYSSLECKVSPYYGKEETARSVTQVNNGRHTIQDHTYKDHRNELKNRKIFK